jgi:hypothetical protein
MPAGRYQWALTYIRSDGQHSGASPAGTITLPAGSGITLQGLPVCTDPSVTEKAVWLTSADGGVLMLADVIANSATSYTFTDDTSDLSYPVETQFLSAPPVGHLSAWFRGRLWVASDSYLYPSQPFAPELFDLREALPARGRIDLMFSRPDDQALMVGTNRGQGWISGDSPATMAYAHATNDPVTPGSLVWIPGDRYGEGKSDTDVPLWMGMQGVYTTAYPYWQLAPVTMNRVQRDFPGRAAAVFDRAQGQYIATLRHT